jgi:hypothetical protein
MMVGLTEHTEQVVELSLLSVTDQSIFSIAAEYRAIEPALSLCLFGLLSRQLVGNGCSNSQDNRSTFR